MSVQDYSLPQYAERYEYIVFEPDTPIQVGAQGAAQPNRNDITFTINDRTSIYDYANGYFDVVFYIERLTVEAGNRNFAVANKTAIVNGVHSLIRRLILYGQDGQTVYDTPRVNQALHVKKLLEMSPDYAESVAENEFWHLDQNADFAEANVPIAPGTNKLDGNLVRRTLAENRQKLNYRIPLKWYSYFNSLKFQNVLLTGMQLRLVVDIENDANLIYRGTDAGAADGRVVIERLTLHLPIVLLRPQAQESYVKSITGSPVRWTYNRERIEQYSITSSEGVFKITGVVKPRKVIFWFLKNTKFTQEGNWQYFDKFNGGIGTLNATLERCRLEFADGSYYPYKDYILGATQKDFARLYGDVLEYAKSNDDMSAGTQLTRKNFAALYSMVFFDLDYKKEALVSDSKDMTFTFTLSASGEGSTCYAYILYEQEASYGKIDNTFVITSEVSR